MGVTTSVEAVMKVVGSTVWVMTVVVVGASNSRQEQISDVWASLQSRGNPKGMSTALSLRLPGVPLPLSKVGTGVV